MDGIDYDSQSEISSLASDFNGCEITQEDVRTIPGDSLIEPIAEIDERNASLLEASYQEENTQDLVRSNSENLSPKPPEIVTPEKVINRTFDSTPARQVRFKGISGDDDVESAQRINVSNVIHDAISSSKPLEIVTPEKALNEPIETTPPRRVSFKRILGDDEVEATQNTDNSNVVHDKMSSFKPPEIVTPEKVINRTFDSTPTKQVSFKGVSCDGDVEAVQSTDISNVVHDTLSSSKPPEIATPEKALNKTIDSTPPRRVSFKGISGDDDVEATQSTDISNVVHDTMLSSKPPKIVTPEKALNKLIETTPPRQVRIEDTQNVDSKDDRKPKTPFRRSRKVIDTPIRRSARLAAKKKQPVYNDDADSFDITAD